MTQCSLWLTKNYWRQAWKDDHCFATSLFRWEMTCDINEAICISSDQTSDLVNLCSRCWSTEGQKDTLICFSNKFAMAMEVRRILGHLDSVYHVYLLTCKSSVHCARSGHLCVEDTRTCFIRHAQESCLERCWGLHFLFSNDKITLCFSFNSIQYCITLLCIAQPMNTSQLWTNSCKISP